MAWLKVSLTSRSVGTEALFSRDLDFGGEVRFGERVSTAFADDFIRADFFIKLIALRSNDASIVVDTATVKFVRLRAARLWRTTPFYRAFWNGADLRCSFR
jgi:hypothetical protein